MDGIHKLELIRWKGQARCPYCGSANATALPAEHRYHCNTCNTSFSVTVGTVLHRTRLELGLWIRAINLVLGTNGRISARRLASELNVDKNTACSLSHKIQVAMHDPQQRLLMIALLEMEQEVQNGSVT